MFIDALGWEIIKDKGFLEDLLPYRYPVQMQFGYSCTAIPTILTGQPPSVHKHLSFYYYAPEKSPFKMFKLLKFLPSKIFDRWRVRHILSRIIKKVFGYTGYFEMYAMPFDRIQYFDYIEKKDLFVPDGLAPVPNIADELKKRKIPHHITNWRLTESQNINGLIRDIKPGTIRFAFLYTAAMDSLLHRVTRDGKEIPEKLEWYSEQIKNIIETVKKHYENFNLYVISDHGMTTLTEVVDVKKIIENLNLKFGKDYVAVYDSTMVRFWYFNDKARTKILTKLEEVPFSHVLTEEETKKYGIYFKDNMYGETILLMDPGFQIAPSDMGINALPAMHGFAPEHEDSIASFLSTEEIKDPPKWVGDYFRIMVEKMDEIKRKGTT